MQLTTFLFLLMIAYGQSISEEKYQIQLNTNASQALSPLWLLKSFKKREMLFCLAECNQDDECLTTTFSKLLMENNCHLYRKIFSQNETELKSNVELFTKDCKNRVTTFDETSCINKPKTLLNIFEIYQNRFQLTVYNHSNFSLMHSYVSVKNSSKTFYYAVQYQSSDVIVYDEDWNFLKILILPHLTLCYAEQTDVNELIITMNGKILKTDTELKVINQLSSSGAYRGIYFNKTENLVYVADVIIKGIYVLSRNLTIVDYFNTTGDEPFVLTSYKNYLIVGSTNGRILIIENRKVIQVYNTICSFINSLLIDDFGFMIIMCRNPQIVYIYHLNGTYTGQSISNVGFNPIYVDFDVKGRLIVMAHDQINIFY